MQPFWIQNDCGEVNILKNISLGPTSLFSGPLYNENLFYHGDLSGSECYQLLIIFERYIIKNNYLNKHTL